jgi:hypothetical protein
MRPGDEHIRGDDRADARLVEQLRCERLDVAGDLVLELCGFHGRSFDPARECAQDELCRELVDGTRARAAEAAAALEQLAFGQGLELRPEPIGGGHEHAAQLHERSPAHLDRAAARDQQQAQRLAALAHPRHRQRLLRECGPCGADRVERVVFAAQPALVTRPATALDYRLILAAEMTSEAGAVMTRALNGPDASPRRVLTGKAKRLRITAHARGHPPLRNDPTTRCRNNRKRVLVAVPVDPDHVVPLVCKHPL